MIPTVALPPEYDDNPQKRKLNSDNDEKIIKKTET